MSNDIESLLHGANEAAALAHRLAMIRIEAEHRLALYRSRSKPDRPAAGAAASPAQPEPPAAAHAAPTLAAHHAPQVAQVPPASGWRGIAAAGGGADKRPNSGSQVISPRRGHG